MSDPTPNTALALQTASTIMPFSSIDSFKAAEQMAKMVCSSSLIPDNYKGQQNIGNCLIAMELASRIGATLLTVMQNMQPIHGKPAWSATFLISAIEKCGKFSPLRYEEKDLGEKTTGNLKYRDRSCVAYATELATGDILRSATISIEMAIKEGWYTRNGSKWPNMSEQMLRYRAAAFFNRAYCPGLTMGLMTREEVEDMGPIVDVQTSTVRIADGIAVPARVTAPPVETVVEPTPSAPAEEPKRPARKRSTELPLGDLTPHQRALEASLKENELTVAEISQAYDELFAAAEPRERATVADFEPVEIQKIMQNLKGLTEIIRTARGSV